MRRGLQLGSTDCRVLDLPNTVGTALQQVTYLAAPEMVQIPDLFALFCWKTGSNYRPYYPMEALHGLAR